ncbi:hypothetical protein Nepgr_019589 [Nepenthes gracilis]|uniref:Uncharacterized protein n=1 Tax=Nepenthes gracilis TaxID=150966 RepID=A0AAD3STR8_NEPGR|nr:hypothetical protein Nepgr_019589 [Nepenthes gracilis]
MGSSSGVPASLPLTQIPLPSALISSSAPPSSTFGKSSITRSPPFPLPNGPHPSPPSLPPLVAPLSAYSLSPPSSSSPSLAPVTSSDHFLLLLNDGMVYAPVPDASFLKASSEVSAQEDTSSVIAYASCTLETPKHNPNMLDRGNDTSCQFYHPVFAIRILVFLHLLQPWPVKSARLQGIRLTMISSLRIRAYVWHTKSWGMKMVPSHSDTFYLDHYVDAAPSSSTQQLMDHLQPIAVNQKKPYIHQGTKRARSQTSHSGKTRQNCQPGLYESRIRPVVANREKPYIHKGPKQARIPTSHSGKTRQNFQLFFGGSKAGHQETGQTQQRDRPKNFFIW